MLTTFILLPTNVYKFGSEPHSVVFLLNKMIQLQTEGWHFRLDFYVDSRSKFIRTSTKASHVKASRLLVRDEKSLDL